MDCDQIVGVYVNPLEKVRIEDLKNFYSVFERAFKIKAAKECSSKFPDCDLIISPKDLGKFGIFSVKEVDAIFDLGYNAARKALETSDTF